MRPQARGAHKQAADGRTIVCFHPATPMLREAGVPDALASWLEPAQRILVEAISQR